MQRSIYDLGLSNKAINSLQKFGVTTVDEFLNISLEEFRFFRGVGEKTFEEISEKLNQMMTESAGFSDENQNYLWKRRFSKRIQNAFSEMNINSKMDLIKHPLVDFYGRKNIGEDTILEIKNYLYNPKNFRELKYSKSFLNKLSSFEIESLNLSTRPYNKFKQKNINYLDEMLLQIKNNDNVFEGLGDKSKNEIFEKINVFLKKNNIEILFDYEKDEDNDSFNEVVFKEITACFEFLKISRHAISRILQNNHLIFSSFNFDAITSFLDTPEMIQLMKNYYLSVSDSCTISKTLFSSCLNNLQFVLGADYLLRYFEKNIIDQKNEWYILRCESVLDVLKNIRTNDRNDYILCARIIEGKTLEEIGITTNLTRERIRQILKKRINKLPLVKEDCYKSLFQFFNFSKNEFLDIFQSENESTYNYLFEKYKKGKLMISEENVEKYTGYQKNQILSYLHEIEKKSESRRELLYKILIYHMQPMSMQELEKEYYKYLNDSKYDVEKYRINIKTANNHLRNCENIVFNQKNEIRFLKIDYSSFCEVIDLETYKNKVISSALIFQDNEELMGEFGIQDGYELFYVLKFASTHNYLKAENMEFRRVPTIIFDSASEMKQTKKLLEELSPIKVNDYFEVYEKKYGVNKLSAATNLAKYLADYLVDGKYVIDIPLIDDRDESEICRALEKRKIWFEDEVELLFERICINTSIDAINSGSLHRIGYKMYPSGYILSEKYLSAYDYFSKEIFNNFITNLNEVDKRIKSLSIFRSYLEERRQELDYIEMDSMIFVKIEYFNEKYSINKKRLLEIQQILISFGKDDYYNSYKIIPDIKESNSLNTTEKELLISNLWFTNCLIKQKNGIYSRRIAGTIILSNKNIPLNIASICKWIVNINGKMSLSNLCESFNAIFGAEMAPGNLAEKIRTDGSWNDLIIESIDGYINQLVEKYSDSDDDYFQESFY